MYVPAEFNEDRIEILHQAMRDLAFGTLVTLGADGLIASHIPLLLEDEPAPFGTITGHMARGNPHTRAGASASETLAIFLGPHAYVTPSWYPSKQETGRVVPTWNYVAIHAYGALECFDDRERLRDIVTRLTEREEAPRAEPWAVTDAPADFTEAMLSGIIGFALPISRLEGKWKMSQNRPAEDRAGVVEHLHEEGRSDVAALIRR